MRPSVLLTISLLLGTVALVHGGRGRRNWGKFAKKENKIYHKKVCLIEDQNGKTVFTEPCSNKLLPTCGAPVDINLQQCKLKVSFCTSAPPDKTDIDTDDCDDDDDDNDNDDAAGDVNRPAGNEHDQDDDKSHNIVKRHAGPFPEPPRRRKFSPQRGRFGAPNRRPFKKKGFNNPPRYRKKVIKPPRRKNKVYKPPRKMKKAWKKGRKWRKGKKFRKCKPRRGSTTTPSTTIETPTSVTEKETASPEGRTTTVAPKERTTSARAETTTTTRTHEQRTTPTRVKTTSTSVAPKESTTTTQGQTTTTTAPPVVSTEKDVGIGDGDLNDKDKTGSDE